MGKIYVIESGSDACGKATQSELLYRYLKKTYYKTLKVEFPNYSSNTSCFVKMYLNGDFGEKPEDVNPYVASTFFAVDRYATFKKEIEKYYDEDYIIVADRYTTSNMVYQAGKYKDKKEKDDFLDWLYDYEFNLYALPKPDKVFFLDLPFEISQSLMKKRKVKNDICKDIHENDEKYLRKVYDSAKYISNKYNWINIDCSKKNTIKSVEDINKLIISNLK